MLAISRALLMNPRLLIMDEPTEGLAPVIVAHVEETLVRLAAEGDVSILVIEQNIGVATQMSDTIAIMVNGRIHRVIASSVIAADRDLQQRLLGVGRHSHEETETPSGEQSAGEPRPVPAAPQGPIRVYNANPHLPTRWSQDVPAARIEAQARTISRPTLATIDGRRVATSRRSPRARRRSRMSSLPARSTPRARSCVISAISSRRRACARGSWISPPMAATRARMSRRRRWLWPADRFGGDRLGGSWQGCRRDDRRLPRLDEPPAGRDRHYLGGGSGGTAIATAGMQTLPVGVPKIMVSTMASGNVAAYVGATDITMMHSVTDVQGLNRVSRAVLGNAAQAMAAMARLPRAAAHGPATRRAAPDKPLVGLTMFGVTTPCVQQVTRSSTRIGSRWSSTPPASAAVRWRNSSIPASCRRDRRLTTEICDMMMGGILPATEDRFGAIIRTKIPMSARSARWTW